MLLDLDSDPLILLLQQLKKAAQLTIIMRNSPACGPDC